MSTVNHNFELEDQICYVQCGYCTTTLLVNVPFSSLSMVVTVKCGHCTSLLSVNMVKASFVPLHLFASLPQSDHHHDQEIKKEISPEVTRNQNSAPIISSDEEEEEEDSDVPSNSFINKPPVKRQRAPSAYNRFIKEEIRRLKAKNPNMAHKQAFSTAAKNWAQFPPSRSKFGEEGSCS